jgi:DNA repair protein RadC
MESKHKLSINQWALEDRPREKMMEKGAAALSDAELLAILIGSGNTEESAVELMRRLLLSCDNNLNSLAKWEVCDYSSFKGMGKKPKRDFESLAQKISMIFSNRSCVTWNRKNSGCSY